MMKRFALLIALFAVHQLHAQSDFLPYSPSDPMPEWASLLYAGEHSAWEIRQAYEDYYLENEFEKTVHTQNYKFWIRRNQDRIGIAGDVQSLSAADLERLQDDILSTRSDNREGEWQYAGPDIHYRSDGNLTPTSSHSNVYCHDRSASNPNILYAGTESGGLYKTVDEGTNWEHVSHDLLIGSVTAVRIHPNDPDIVLFSAANDLWRTEDGGLTWEVIGQPSFVSMNISAWEIHFYNPDPNVVLAATNQGLFRSTDLGDNWTEVLMQETSALAFKPFSPQTVYALQYDPALKYCRFHRSFDAGQTWELIDNGWYTPIPGDFGLIDIQGGRLAVTEADPERIYALLAGYQLEGAVTTTNGWVGVWKSEDGGDSWSFPHGQIGTPYTAEHPNLMNFTGDDGTYSQIYYNTTMVASQLDPDKVLIGGLNLWQSNDGCATYFAKGGYVGYVPNLHVDMQEIRIYKTDANTEEIWLSNDGGIHHSTTFMESHESRCRGIRAVNLWGYDQGWNEDIMVGGRYHNGNMAFYESYPEKEFLALGGGEAATGYVNYSDERKTYFSDIGGRVIPTELTGIPQGFSMSTSPNESYWFNNSSRILFDQRYYNLAWLGKDNVLYRSINGGGSFGEHYSFGSSPSNRILWIEQSYANPEVMVLHQALGNTSKLWRSEDGGDSWEEMDLPYTYRNLFFSLGSTNPDEIWVGYTNGSNGNKVFRSTDAGNSWENLTTSLLDNQEVWGVAHQYGTNGGVYVAMKYGMVYYRNNDMGDWEVYADGLPVSIEPLRIVPYYKGGKIRLASWNLGVWERDLYEPSSLMADFSADFARFFCPGDPVHFVDHSVVGPDATYEWSFPGAEPSSSMEKYPTVTYLAPGEYDVTLVVTQDGQQATVTKTAYIASEPILTEPIEEGFEAGAFADNWKDAHPTGGNSNWAVGNIAGGYDQSEYSMYFDNYWNDVGDNRDEIWTPRFSLEDSTDPILTFDVAYAPYGWPYTDTLVVNISVDCGQTWYEAYHKGHETLATAPATGDPFVPTAEQWRTEEIDLSDFNGEAEVIVAFQNRGSWGNFIFVDNINLQTGNSVSETSATKFAAFPNPAQDYLMLDLGDTPQTGMLQLLDASGSVVMARIMNGSMGQIRLSTGHLARGLYVLRLNDRALRVVLQ